MIGMKHYEKMLELGCFSIRDVEKLTGSRAAATSILYDYQKKGIQIGEDGVKFEKLTKEMVDAFVKEVRVYAKDQIEIVWSFSKPEVE